MDKQKKQEPCCTSTVLMVEPVAFTYNAETAVNNYFQQKSSVEKSKTQALALIEFNNLVQLLRDAGVEVITVKDTPFPHTPDSIFPNNWISFHRSNHVIFYPMFAENRRLERRMDLLLEVEEHLGRKFHYTDYSIYEKEGKILEGTGSFVLDRRNRIAFATLSPRTDKELFLMFCEENDYRPVVVNATQYVGDKLMPIYHTNVLMCVANKLVIVCIDAVRDPEERAMLEREIEESGKELFAITEAQMHSFAGNMLQLRNKDNEQLLAMSQAAYDSLTAEQRERLAAHYKLIVAPIPTIEQQGGGSVRCMICEVY